MFFRKNKNKKVNLIRRFFRTPPEASYTIKKYMGPCPYCESERTVTIVSEGLTSREDEKYSQRQARRGVPIKIISREEYRNYTSFGANAFCRSCKKYFQGNLQKLDVPYRGDVVEILPDTNN